MKLSFTKNSRSNTGILLGASLIGLSLLGFSIYQIRSQNREGFDLEALTVVVEESNIPITIDASGRIEPIKSVNVSPKEPGRLVKLLVEQGDRVKEGQTLAIMENQELGTQTAQAQAEVNQSQASLQEGTAQIKAEIAQSQARLQQLEARLNQAQNRIPRDIQQVQAQITAAQSRLGLTQQRIKRNQYLLAQGAIAQDAFDEIKDNAQNAQAEITELTQRRQQLQATGQSEINQIRAEIREAQIALEQQRTTAPAEIIILEARLAQAEASLRRAQIQYADTIVQAPFSGIISQRYAVEGSFVAPSASGSSTASASANSILALAQGLEVVAKLTELDIGQLQPGQAVTIVADSYPDQEFAGEIKRIAPEAIIEDNVTSFEVRIKLLTGQNQLRSKMNVDVTFVGQEISNGLVVPTVAIFTENGEQGVMIPDANEQPQFQPVKTGLYLEEQIQILEGVTPGQRVFIDLPDTYQSPEA